MVDAIDAVYTNPLHLAPTTKAGTMKALIAGLGIAVGLVALAPTAEAHPGSPEDFLYYTMLTNGGVTVPDDMIEAAGQFGREICAMAAAGAPLIDIDTLVHLHFTDVGKAQTQLIELSAGKAFCPPEQRHTL